MIYPIGIQTFEKIIEGKCLYVDKTDYVYKLVSEGSYYFLSRPRRFGKSLLISTLEAYFLGKKELFRGLKIDSLEKDWEAYPVLRLDMNAENYTRDDAVEKILDRHLLEWEKVYGDGIKGDTLSGRFAGIIRRACEQTGKRVVILIDEYDKPLTSTIGNDSLNEKFRNELKAFYGVMKSADAYIRFGILTGVTKFSKISVFSDVNQPKDISMRKDFQAICGITDEELETYCHEPIQELADINGISYDDMREKIRKKYDGYHFCKNGVGIYNPFSVINALDAKELGSFWFATGTPGLLTTLLRDSNLSVDALCGGRVSSEQLGGKESFRSNPLPIMYQTGYLTIKSYDEEFDEYELDFPNEEVKNSFTEALVPAYLHDKYENTIFDARAFAREVRAGEVEKFMKRLNTLYANLDFAIAGDSEKYFHNTLNVIFMMVGLFCQVEKHSSDGSMDLVIQTRDLIYIIEIKYDESAETALQQIETNNYAAPFAMDSRKLIKLGIAFDRKTRRVKDWSSSV